jgi:zinc protease
MKVQWGEVDGVPTVYAEDGQVPGPLHACLMFGTGRSDETLRAAGINHIIEHLVLHSLGATPYSWNGEISPVSTLFWAQGGPDQIVEFFEFVVRGLNELPIERLADELRVLEIESERRGISRVGFDLSKRYGPHGPGLLGWPEYGLRCLDAETIVEWARTKFTASNAVLWLSGPIPERLQLRDLPMSDPVERPQLPPPLVPARAYIATEAPAVSVSFISELQWGILPIMEIARQRAHDRLRRDAISYAVEFSHVRVGGGGALEYLQADAADGALEQVTEELVRVVDDLARSGPNAEEVATIREHQRQFHDHPQRVVSYLDSAARSRLVGDPVLLPEEIEAILDAQDPRSLQEDLAHVMPTIVAVGPEAAADRLDDWAVPGSHRRSRPRPHGVGAPKCGATAPTCAAPNRYSGTRRDTAPPPPSQARRRGLRCRHRRGRRTTWRPVRSLSPSEPQLRVAPL